MTDANGHPRLMSPTDVAETCGVPVRTVYKWRANGDGPRSFRVGRHVRFHPDDVAAWLDAQRTADAR